MPDYRSKTSTAGRNLGGNGSVIAAGPAEAVNVILTGHGNFVVDSAMEKYSLSFNPSGYLHQMG